MTFFSFYARNGVETRVFKSSERLTVYQMADPMHRGSQVSADELSGAAV